MPKAAKVHDRRALDLPINSRVAPAIVADPYSTIGEQITVLRSTRDDPLAGMAARNQINTAQLAPGREWQKFHEMSEVGAIRAIDPTKEAVDGGQMPDPITQRQIKAFYELLEAKKVLGIDGAKLIDEILGHRISVRQAAEARGCYTGREVDYVSRRFRECLDRLAVLWGFAGRP